MPRLPAANTKPFPWKCGHCRERAVQPAVVPYITEAEYDGRTYTVTVPELRVPRCQNCKELVLDSAANRQITESLRQHLGLLTPEQIRQTRESLGLTQRQLASHLGIAEATLSRWETGGQIQQRALDRLLRLYFSSASVRAALADEDRLAERGISVRSCPETGSGNDSQSATLSEGTWLAWLQAARQHLASDAVRGSLRRFLRSCRLPEERVEAALPGLVDLVPPLIMWSLISDKGSIESWRGLPSATRRRRSSMYKWFTDVVNAADTGEKSAVRALQVWQYLIAKASNRQIVRYDELRELMEYADNRPLTQILGCIMFYCEQNGLPPLTLIVVNQTGVPGDGFTAEQLQNYHQRREDVFKFPWYRVVPPTVAEFREACVRGR